MNYRKFPVSRILVINVTRIGDTMLCTPAIRAIAMAYPDAELTVLAHPQRKEVLENIPFISKLGSITKYNSVFRGWFSRGRFDLAFVYGVDESLITYALRVSKRVIAFKQGVAKLDELMFKSCDRPTFQSCHNVEYALMLPDALHIPRSGLYLSYTVREAENQWAIQELSDLKVQGNFPIIGLQIASFPTKGYRDWPIDNFISLCALIKQDFPAAHFMIFGGSLERERTQLLHAAFNKCSSHYAGRISLRKTAALMNVVDLYVGVDTGPTHIMGALHRPMIAMYHGYSPGRLLAPLEHPCLYMIEHPRTGQGSSPDDYDMAEISVDYIYKNVILALDAEKPNCGH